MSITAELQMNCAHWVGRAMRTNYGRTAYRAVPKAPSDWRQLQQHEDVLHGHGVLPVQESDGPSIYGTPEGNELFRAWHDCIHLSLGRGFSLPDELAVAAHGDDQLRALGCPISVRLAIYMDVAAQAQYYDKYRKFVVDQIEFMNRCLEHGSATALEMGEI